MVGAAVICPFCQHTVSRVVDSRVVGDAIRRRRSCARCGQRFSTMERIERRLPQVIKKDGRRVPFEREKIRDGLQLADAVADQSRTRTVLRGL